ncbi:MAG: hypothetical protein WCF14_09740 [Nitrososphaeraceae archaeon]
MIQKQIVPYHSQSFQCSINSAQHDEKPAAKVRNRKREVMMTATGFVDIGKVNGKINTF